MKKILIGCLIPLIVILLLFLVQSRIKKNNIINSVSDNSFENKINENESIFGYWKNDENELLYISSSYIEMISKNDAHVIHSDDFAITEKDISVNYLSFEYRLNSTQELVLHIHNNDLVFFSINETDYEILYSQIRDQRNKSIVWE